MHDGGGPRGLEVAGYFDEGVGATGVCRVGVLDDGDGLHEVGDSDFVAEDGEGDGSCRGAVGG